MPPLPSDGLKAVFYHRVFQQHTVVVLLFGNAFVVGVRNVAKEVEGTAHVHVFSCSCVYDGEINGGTTGVTGLGGDEPAGEDCALGNVGVEHRLH